MFSSDQNNHKILNKVLGSNEARGLEKDLNYSRKESVLILNSNGVTHSDSIL